MFSFLHFSKLLAIKADSLLGKSRRGEAKLDGRYAGGSLLTEGVLSLCFPAWFALCLLTPGELGQHSAARPKM